MADLGLNLGLSCTHRHNSTVMTCPAHPRRAAGPLSGGRPVRTESVLCLRTAEPTGHQARLRDSGPRWVRPPAPRTTLPGGAGAGGYRRTRSGVPEVEAGAAGARAEREARPAWPGARSRRARAFCSSASEFQAHPEAAAEATWLREAGAEAPQHLQWHCREAGAGSAQGTPAPASASLVPPGAHATGSQLRSEAQHPPSRCPKDGRTIPPVGMNQATCA